MVNSNNNKSSNTKPIISAEVTPFEKEAYKAWWQDKFASETDAVRSHVRKVINYDPESQAQNEKSSHDEQES